MNITFVCPECRESSRTDFDEKTKTLNCSSCKSQIKVPPGSVAAHQVNRCLVCPSEDLYVRKDFPQRLGVSLVVVGIVGSSIAWAYANLFWTFAILFATALADLALFAVVGNALMCYRCQAQYRGVEQNDVHGAFDLEVHEKYRQEAARLEVNRNHEAAADTEKTREV